MTPRELDRQRRRDTTHRLDLIIFLLLYRDRVHSRDAVLTAAGYTEEERIRFFEDINAINASGCFRHRIHADYEGICLVLAE